MTITKLPVLYCQLYLLTYWPCSAEWKFEGARDDIRSRYKTLVIKMLRGWSRGKGSPCYLPTRGSTPPRAHHTDWRPHHPGISQYCTHDPDALSQMLADPWDEAGGGGYGEGEGLLLWQAQVGAQVKAQAQTQAQGHRACRPGGGGRGKPIFKSV